ncbi:MAG TPA: M48 family metalloprotease [Blastocatellia bacterium]|nr:M48 family metalloprotease [Blastocatellia bacterium]
MIPINNRYAYRMAAWMMAAVILITPVVSLAQTRIVAPRNNFRPEQDVQLGRQAAAEVTRQMPLLSQNSDVDHYVERVGRRLVAAIPPEYQHPEFQYSFDVVNARDINAFALPGGPMFVNRGMIEAARNEGEMAGVMAHELSHVILRHGTAQATKAQSPGVQLGAIGGAILGAVIGGNVGGVIAQGTQLGLGAYLLKYSREYETQADVLGAQIMARAGYDPRDLANMFRTIERQSGGSGGPEWLSSHPNPGNRYGRINEEAARLRVQPSAQDDSAFYRVQTELRRMSQAPTMEQIARSQQRYPQQNGRQYPQNSRVSTRVESPSSSFRTYNGGNLFRIAVPDNWREFTDQNSITFAPEGAYGDYQGQSVFTHGAIAGVANVQARNLRMASDQYINGLLQSNQYLQSQSNYRQGTIDGRPALAMTLAGRSTVTGQMETVVVYTTMLRNGGLFYLVTVAPRDQYSYYDRAFQQIVRSINLNG